MNEYSDSKNIENNNEINEINEKQKDIKDKFIENMSDIINFYKILFLDERLKNIHIDIDNI